MSRQSKPLPQPSIKSSELTLTGDSNTTSINNPTVIGADPDFKRSGDEIICPQCSTQFKSFSPSLAVTCPACGLSGFQFPDTVPTCAGCGTRGECFIDDGVHWKLWTPFPRDVMQRFQAQTLNPDRVRDHLGELSEWSTRTPNTIRRMDPQQLENLRQEIIDAIVAQGATRERAEELAASIPSNRDEVSAESAEALADLMDDESAMPYLDKNGDLVIPHNCPKKYRWWQGGQTIAETRAELEHHVEIAVESPTELPGKNSDNK